MPTQAPRTLRAASALLHRLEARLVHTTGSSGGGGMQGDSVGGSSSRAGPQPNHAGAPSCGSCFVLWCLIRPYASRKCCV